MKLSTKFIVITIAFIHLNSFADNSTDTNSLSLTQSTIEDTFTIEEERVLVRAIKENTSAQKAMISSVNKISTDFNSGKLTEQSMPSYLIDYLKALTETHSPASLINLQKQMAADANERIVKQNSTRSDIFKYFLRNLSEMNKSKQTNVHNQIPDNIIVDFSRLLGAFYDTPEIQNKLREPNQNFNELPHGIIP